MDKLQEIQFLDKLKKLIIDYKLITINNKINI